MNDNNKPFELNELINFQDKAIVSSTLLKKKTGTITLFAFAEGQALSEHTAPFDALVQILDGQMEITIGGDPQVVKAGQGIILPANIPHALRAVENAKMLLTMIKSDNE
ncbi:MAG: cupin domain-containing protein [Candidatus Marinimicrobia bacterium]|nr:cupin domain-containing protein [Candidatus Neomarinimicrobiota bacterium]MCF7904193.1 cupin domain-containing protein [Candidatus Neomarinimicrobiota bacterium]